MRIDDRKVIQSVKSTWSILHLELKSLVLPPLEGNIKGRKLNKHTHRHTLKNTIAALMMINSII